MHHLLQITNLTPFQIQTILEQSLILHQSSHQPLKGKTVLFAFEKPSLRTKVGTEVALSHLGAHVVHVEAKSFFEGNIVHAKEGEALTGREALKDTVQNVNQWCDAIFSRVFAHSTLENLTHYATIPVINALSEHHHPLQALADMLTLQQHFGDTEKITLAFVGDANNVAFSLFEVLLMLGHNALWAGPEAYGFPEAKRLHLQALASQYGGTITFTHDPNEAVHDVDVIYTDTFVSMGEEDLYEEKIKHFAPYQVNADLMAKAKPHTGFMHCLPAHRGVEVTDEVIDSPQSWVLQQAKNRMITSKGVFAHLLT